MTRHGFALFASREDDVLATAAACICGWRSTFHLQLIGALMPPTPPPTTLDPDSQVWMAMSDHDRGRIGVLVHIGQRRYIRATWSGGPWVEVQFLPLPKPTEVIDVWDYEAGKAVIEWPKDADGDPLKRIDGLTPSHEAVARHVLAWCAKQEDPDWWDAYQRNGKYDR